jgi:nuclear pore complex protein Nup98-Nup96
MTRFAAYSSESSSEEEEIQPQTPTVFFKGRSQRPNVDADDGDEDDGSDSEESESSSSSGSEPSEMQEDELLTSPPRPHGKSKAKDKSALVEDDNGDVRYAHEVDKRVSPGSASSRSSPGSKVHPGSRGDPTIIPWAQQIGVESQRMHVMQASLFRNQEEAAALKTMNQSVKPKGPAIRLETDARTTSRKHRRDSDGDAMRYDSREVSIASLHSDLVNTLAAAFVWT